MAAIRITQSVGLGGTNSLNDVKTVQTALNKLLKLIPPTQVLVVDGRLTLAQKTQKLLLLLSYSKAKY